MDEVIDNDSKILGGRTGLLLRYFDMQKEFDGKMYQIQTAKFFNELDQDTALTYFSQEDFSKIKEKMLADSVKADERFFINLIRGFPINKTTYKIDEKTKEYSTVKIEFSPAFSFGDIKALTEAYSAAYLALLREIEVKEKINGVEKEFKFRKNNHDSFHRLRQLFTKKVLAHKEFLPHKSLLESTKEKLKKASIENTVEILNASGTSLSTPYTAQGLTKALEQINKDILSDDLKNHMQSEIEEYEFWENLDKQLQ